eukprot:g33271.t1
MIYTGVGTAGQRGELGSYWEGTCARAFGEALKVNKTLTSLDLYNNGIGDAGAQAMGEALRHSGCHSERSSGGG